MVELLFVEEFIDGTSALNWVSGVQNITKSRRFYDF